MKKTRMMMKTIHYPTSDVKSIFLVLIHAFETYGIIKHINLEITPFAFSHPSNTITKTLSRSHFVCTDIFLLYRPSETAIGKVSCSKDPNYIVSAME
ncbi:hypothetical protein JTE90_011242 [Oedothorax gibbosus]|uniref:Uncharacterized protein n=1 Tax=Oedothorax gibbosus TaxID=931172 RepID=A0AAV6W240_9ARAC|nr:hypothetical protein JTE90_011242 [Oedothorax gibbosus]